MTRAPRPRLRLPVPMVVAACLFAVHGLSRLFGVEDCVGVLSGTPVPGISFELAALGAAFHLLSWFGAVLVAPILVVASALLELSDVLASREGGDLRREGREGAKGMG
ncbi:MAG: hypothetical protein KC619_00365 [Myxococcales bacterium]|nr:hypothetical protein [Myxococcales bacterium]